MLLGEVIRSIANYTVLAAVQIKYGVARLIRGANGELALCQSINQEECIVTTAINGCAVDSSPRAASMAASGGNIISSLACNDGVLRIANTAIINGVLGSDSTVLDCPSYPSTNPSTNVPATSVTQTYCLPNAGCVVAAEQQFDAAHYVGTLYKVGDGQCSALVDFAAPGNCNMKMPTGYEPELSMASDGNSLVLSGITGVGTSPQFEQVQMNNLPNLGCTNSDSVAAVISSPVGNSISNGRILEIAKVNGAMQCRSSTLGRTSISSFSPLNPAISNPSVAVIRPNSAGAHEVLYQNNMGDSSLETVDASCTVTRRLLIPGRSDSRLVEDFRAGVSLEQPSADATVSPIQTQVPQTTLRPTDRVDSTSTTAYESTTSPAQASTPSSAGTKSSSASTATVSPIQTQVPQTTIRPTDRVDSTSTTAYESTTSPAQASTPSSAGTKSSSASTAIVSPIQTQVPQTTIRPTDRVDSTSTTAYESTTSPVRSSVAASTSTKPTSASGGAVVVSTVAAAGPSLSVIVACPIVACIVISLIIGGLLYWYKYRRPRNRNARSVVSEQLNYGSIRSAGNHSLASAGSENTVYDRGSTKYARPDSPNHSQSSIEMVRVIGCEEEMNNIYNETHSDKLCKAKKDHSESASISGKASQYPDDKLHTEVKIECDTEKMTINAKVEASNGGNFYNIDLDDNKHLKGFNKSASFKRKNDKLDERFIDDLSDDARECEDAVSNYSISNNLDSCVASEKSSSYQSKHLPSLK